MKYIVQALYKLNQCARKKLYVDKCDNIAQFIRTGKTDKNIAFIITNSITSVF